MNEQLRRAPEKPDARALLFAADKVGDELDPIFAFPQGRRFLDPVEVMEAVIRIAVLQPFPQRKDGLRFDFGLLFPVRDVGPRANLRRRTERIAGAAAEDMPNGDGVPSFFPNGVATLPEVEMLIGVVVSKGQEIVAPRLELNDGYFREVLECFCAHVSCILLLTYFVSAGRRGHTTLLCSRALQFIMNRMEPPATACEARGRSSNADSGCLETSSRLNAEKIGQRADIANEYNAGC